MKKRRPMVAPGMDLDAGEEAAELGNESRQERHPPAVELVGHAVGQDGMEAGVAQNDFEGAFGRRVLSEDRVELFPDSSEHGVS